MSLWDSIKARFSEDAPHLVHAFIPNGSGEPLEPYGSYFRVWLDDMHLARSVDWGQQAFPAVHAEVRVKFADEREEAFTAIARLPEDALAPGIHREFRIADLMPYNGGTVEVEAALVGLPGKNYLSPAVDVLGEVSKLLVPPLGQVLPLARSLAQGTRQLLVPYVNDVHLGLHRTLVSEGGGSSGVMRPGSLAVIRADEGELDPGRLCVVDHSLRYARDGGAATAPVGFDYMLLRIEARTERDDWRLKDIDAPLRKALGALDQGNTNAAAGYRAVALAAARESPDIAEHDRARVIQAIKDEYARTEGGGRGATGRAPADLTEVMLRNAMSRARSAAIGELTEEEVFAP